MNFFDLESDEERKYFIKMGRAGLKSRVQSQTQAKQIGLA